MHLTAEYGRIGTVNALIQNGADVNALDQRGWTPLHFAARDGDEDIVGVLITNGANPLLKNKDGSTPRGSMYTGSCSVFGQVRKDLGNVKSYTKIEQLLKEAEEEQLKQQATKQLLKEEEKQLKKLNKEANHSSQDNQNTTPLLEETEKKQPTSAIKKGLFASGAVAVLGTAVEVALFATGTVAVELISIVIAVAAIAAAALAVGGITYMMLKPSTEMDEVEKEQGIIGDERKA
ncbi:ankyrin repeat domain-containing protein [Wolbachia endosymbiont (group A) of Myopa testacea]|uniref:ankyrin repeat domain-containing protein n=1 Tax=Wolbachia endosymbiont (group A) of Myopa testacea TaxID=3066148 RepID=UPI0031332F40